MWINWKFFLPYFTLWTLEFSLFFYLFDKREKGNFLHFHLGIYRPQCLMWNLFEMIRRKMKSFINILFFLGQREKDSSANAKTTVHGLFAIEIIHSSDVVYFSMHWCFWCLYASILSGKYPSIIPRKIISNSIQ